MINIADIRAQFPILNQKVNNKPLVYFDNGATSQKPKMVIDAINEYYLTINSNVHRGIHSLSQIATDKMENSRAKIQAYINAELAEEVIFTMGTTDSINLVANGFRNIIQKGDEIIISSLEHHANIVPWQMLCENTGAILKVIPLLENLNLDLQAYKELLSDKTKIVAVTQVSNTLGILTPIQEIIDLAHQKGAYVLVDGAQSIPHSKVDMQKLNADFFTFSLHKMYGPTGVGILYGKKEILSKLEPSRGGGAMIDTVTFEKTTYTHLPHRLEAGTPNIAGNIASGYAIDFIQNIGIETIQKHENELLQYAIKKLENIENIQVYATDTDTAGAVSFNATIPNVHASDVGHILNMQGIAVRTGHHCTQPIMRHLEVPATVRASFAIYNTIEEVDLFIQALKKAMRMLS